MSDSEMSPASKTSDVERVVMLQVSSRELRMIELAVWRFMNDAISRAEFYSMKRADIPPNIEHVKAFQRDADDAGALVRKLREIAT